MKKAIIIISSIFAVSTVNAQKGGFMSKLKDKVNEISETAKAKEATAYLGKMPTAKDLSKDIEATDLDNLTTNKDSKNISGIYYSIDPMRVGFNGLNNFNFAQKFHVNYEEKPEQKDILTITTRYNLDKKNQLPVFAFTVANNSPKDFPVATSTKMGHWMLDGVKDRSANPDGHYQYLSMNPSYYRFNSKNNPNGASKYWDFPGHNITQLEPGILIIESLEILFENKDEPKWNDVVEHSTYFMLYKKEKEEAAKKYTKKEVFEKLKAFYLPYRKAYKQVENGSVEMVKPMASFKDMPSNAELMAVAKEGFAQRSHWKEQLVYVYPTTAWTNKFENVGVLGRTLTYRVMQIQVVMKEDDQCKITQFMIRQDNTYQAGSNAENFKGNPLKFYGDTDKTDINCTKANQYKK